MATYPKYELMDILTSDKFINNTFKAADITISTYREASFNVYGDFKKYRITKSIAEDFDRVLMDKSNEVPIVFEEDDDSGGFIYSKKGYGFWKPVDSMRIIGIHFHPPEYCAIPSCPDIQSTYIWTGHNNSDYWFDEFTKFLHAISIVGQIEDSIITLFIYQCTDKFKFKNKTFEIGILEGMNDELPEKCGDKYRELNYSDNRLLDKVAEYLSSRGFFKACVIRFKNKEEYRKEIIKIGDFDLIYPSCGKQLELF